LPWWERQRAQLAREFNDDLRLELIQLENLYAAHDEDDSADTSGQREAKPEE
jgi:hypothetical protein